MKIKHWDTIFLKMNPDALAASSKEMKILRSVVLKQQAEMRSLRDELFDQNVQMMDQLTKLAGMEPEDASFKA